MKIKFVESMPFEANINITKKIHIRETRDNPEWREVEFETEKIWILLEWPDGRVLRVELPEEAKDFFDDCIANEIEF